MKNKLNRSTVLGEEGGVVIAQIRPYFLLDIRSDSCVI